MKQIKYSYLFLLAAIALGLLSGWSQQQWLIQPAQIVSTLFMNFLRLIAAPIVFLSIFSTLLGMRGLAEMRLIGRKVFGYTLLTTALATLVALGLFLLIDPTRTALKEEVVGHAVAHQGSYASFLVDIVPSNLVKAFLENNVIAIAFVAFLFGIAGLKLSTEHRSSLNQLFSALFKLLLKATQLVIGLMPIGIWAFTTLLVQELQQDHSHVNSLMLYLGVVLAANLLQGFLVIPLLLKWKGISPLKTARGSSRALILAFFSKSSNATLPVTLECAENRLGIRPRIAQFSLPLCTVINMNGCAAFMLTTVLFVAGIHGHVFAPIDYAIWVVLAIVAAIGNAGVPMGCFFLSSAFLIAMDVPLTTMGLILPFYAFLDMVETALNVWSDIGVTALVNKEVAATDELGVVAEG